MLLLQLVLINITGQVFDTGVKGDCRYTVMQFGSYIGKWLSCYEW